MDKEALLANRVADKVREIEIEGVGTVTVRALSRWEFIQAGKLKDDPMQQERFILSRAMVDPVVGEDDVAAWQKNSPLGEINGIAMIINELSGIGSGADKSDLP
jgi:hypothetical protein